MAIDCKNITRKIQMCGFGILGQGFYALNIPEVKVKVAASSGVLTVLEGDATEEKWIKNSSIWSRKDGISESKRWISRNTLLSFLTRIHRIPSPSCLLLKCHFMGLRANL